MIEKEISLRMRWQVYRAYVQIAAGNLWEALQQFTEAVFYFPPRRYFDWSDEIEMQSFRGRGPKINIATTSTSAAPAATTLTAINITTTQCS